MLSENWRHELCEDALTWFGTPYVPKGRVKGVGVDCGGLVYELYNPKFGPFAAFPDDYAPDWAAHSADERYLDFIMPYVHEVPAVKPGGFSLFHLGLAYSHAGIMLEDGNYIHAWGRTREGHVTITRPRAMLYLANKFCSGFKPKHFDPNNG